MIKTVIHRRAAEGLHRWPWQEPVFDFTPSEFRFGPVVGCSALAGGLRYLGLTVAVGVIGNRADDILDQLLPR